MWWCWENSLACKSHSTESISLDFGGRPWLGLCVYALEESSPCDAALEVVKAFQSVITKEKEEEEVGAKTNIHFGSLRIWKKCF